MHLTQSGLAPTCAEELAAIDPRVMPQKACHSCAPGAAARQPAQGSKGSWWSVPGVCWCAVVHALVLPMSLLETE